MGTIFDNIRDLRLWHILVIVVVLTVSAASVYGGYVLITPSSGTALEENQQLIPVSRGNLVNDVSINGSLIYPIREVLRFSTQGTVGELVVEEGQRVSRNDVLVKLDSETIAKLEKSVAQNKISLRNAQDALEKSKSPYTPRQIAKAESDVASAMLSLKQTEESLEALVKPTDLEINKAENAVASAQLSVHNAQVKLSELLETSAQDLANAQSSVARAESALKTSEDNLAVLVQPSALQLELAQRNIINAKLDVAASEEGLATALASPTETDLSQAQKRVDEASSHLNSKKTDLTQYQRDSELLVKEVEDDMVAAKKIYADTSKTYLGVDLSAEMDKTPDNLIIEWGTSLETIFDTGPKSEKVRDFLRGDLVDDPSTPWNEVSALIWIALYPGNITPTCDNARVLNNVLCVQKELSDSWTSAVDATQRFEDLTVEVAGTISAKQIAVTSAELALQREIDAQEDVKSGPSDLDISSLRTALAIGKVKLDDFEEELRLLRSGPNDLDKNVLEKQVAVAKADLSKAKDDLASIIDGPNALNIEAQKRQLDLEKSKLDQAISDLQNLTTTIDPLETAVRTAKVELAKTTLSEAQDTLSEYLTVDQLEVEFKEADVKSAQVALDAAISDLEGTVLKAPWNGIVSMLNVEQGQQINPNTNIVEMVDPAVVEVDGIVDEIDVMFLTLHATAIVTLEALQDQQLGGVVSEIASTARTQQGVVSYPIRVQVSIPEGIELPEGLSAVARVIIREEKDGLLVPIQALHGTFDQPTLKIHSNGTIEERPVTLGISDDFWTVVTGGLVEGELVAIQVKEATESRFSFRTFSGSSRGSWGSRSRSSSGKSSSSSSKSSSSGR